MLFEAIEAVPTGSADLPPFQSKTKKVLSVALSTLPFISGNFLLPYHTTLLQRCKQHDKVLFEV